MNTKVFKSENIMSFHRIGSLKAARDIEQDELASFYSSSKPYSFKIPTHVIEAIDICSSHMGLSRNQLVNQILTNFLAQSFSEFVDGYSSTFAIQGKTEAQILLDELDKATQGVDASDEAIGFLNQEIINFIQVNDMADAVYVGFDGKAEAE